MWILALAIVAASTLGDEPGPAELARLLGSADRLEREEAARTLEELGAPALPALREAEKSGSGEARSRASAIARSIEGRLLDRGSLVAVDFDGRPLEEAVRALADRSGHAIRLDAGDDAALPRRPVAAKAPAPVSFWEALDMIGRAGHVRHDPGAGVWDRDPAPLIHLADGEPPASTLYRGAFRVHLLALHRRRDLDLASRRGEEPSPAGVLSFDVQAFAEPGRFLDLNGIPRIEAEDDRGRPLPPPPADAERLPRRGLSWDVPGAIRVLQWRIPLGLPDPGAARLRRVRGTLPVIVSATRPDPIVIPLDDPPGRAYRHEGMTIRFRMIQDHPKQMQFDVILTDDPGPAAGRGRDERAGAALRHRFQFQDRNGRPLPWLRLDEGTGPGNERRTRFMISEAERPLRMRVHGLVWAATEIPFAFEDVPLP